MVNNRAMAGLRRRGEEGGSGWNSGYGTLDVGGWPWVGPGKDVGAYWRPGASDYPWGLASKKWSDS